MSSEEENEKSVGNDLEAFHEFEKRSKVCYTRDFLLSLSELDVCKKLPSGFDQSLLSELEDGYHGTQDRLRNPGSLPLQNHRLTYSSSPPTRGDSSNYSQGVYGKWDNRSSGRSDRDSDSQSDKDSDVGHPQVNQSRKPWQSGEHDGLLGSGTFSRPPGYTAGLSGPKGRSNDQYQLKKSNEPYHHPRPYKAGPLSRREMTDSLNDETFGYAECGNQDRAEEERRRRESFELMRKEQHKSFQEKQNLTTGKLKKDANITELVGESDVENRAFGKNAELDESMTHSLSNNDSSKPSLQSSVVRPLVPPGFKRTVIEKNSNTASLAHPRVLEVGRLEVEESSSHAKTIAQNGIFDNQEEILLVQKLGNVDVHTTSEKRNEHSDIEIFNGKHSDDNKIISGDPSAQAQQPSILDKLFNSVLSDNLSGSLGIVEKQDTKQDDPWNQPNVSHSSKFAQWFLDDEKKGTEDPSHTMPNDLLSLISSSEKHGSQGSEITEGHLTSDIIPSVELPKKLNKSNNDETPPPILTCEDLEQTIVSGYSESSSIFQKNLQGQNLLGPVEPKAETDNRASQHLLSLLQKGPVLQDTLVPPMSETGFSEEKVENVTQFGSSLTLETLFGSAFMKELQSAEAPVSALGSSVKTNINGPLSWFGNNDTQAEANLSKQQSDMLAKRGGFERKIDIRLPEEESLIGAGDLVFNPFGNLIDRESQSSNGPFDISDKLAALSTGFKDERPSMHGPYGSLDHEIPFHNLQAQSSSPRFHPSQQMNHARPFLHIDSYPTHASPPMNFNAQEAMIQRVGPTDYHMMRPHPMLQQMQMQMQMQRPTSNILPRHLQELNRGSPVPLHLRTRGSIQEHNHMQGFPFDQQQASFGGPGMSMQAPEVRGNHPEAFQRLLEMELRANSSKRVMHPFDPLGNNNQGLHGHDLDMSFRYR